MFFTHSKVDDTTALVNYPYRDDAVLIYKAINTYVKDIVMLYYRKSVFLDSSILSIYDFFCSYKFLAFATFRQPKTALQNYSDFQTFSSNRDQTGPFLRLVLRLFVSFLFT